MNGKEKHSFLLKYKNYTYKIVFYVSALAIVVRNRRKDNNNDFSDGIGMYVSRKER